MVNFIQEIIERDKEETKSILLKAGFSDSDFEISGNDTSKIPHGFGVFDIEGHVKVRRISNGIEKSYSIHRAAEGWLSMLQDDIDNNYFG